MEDGRLVFCIEQEKLDNSPRYQQIERLETVVAVLAENGLAPRDIDRFVIDGWDAEIQSEFQVLMKGSPIALNGAPYVERDAENPLTAYQGSGLMLDNGVCSYESYPHVVGHVASAYCTSSFAKAEEPAFCLVWDGCIFPRLYYVEQSGVRFVGCLFPMIGHAYAAAGQHFGPYRRELRTGWKSVSPAS